MSPLSTMENSPKPTTTRLNRSTSWFNSLSRRTPRKTPNDKKSYGGVYLGDTPNQAKPCLKKSPTSPDMALLSPTQMPSPAFQSSSSKSTEFLAPNGPISAVRFDISDEKSTGSPHDNTQQHCSFDITDHASRVKFREKMIKHDAAMRLKFSKSTDFSTLDLTEIDDSKTDLNRLDLNISGDEMANQLGQAQPNGYYTIDSRRLASKHKKSQRDTKLLYGVKQFNLDPKRGLEYLNDSGFVENESAESVAAFLFRQERLSKKQIGCFLGSHLEFNKDVLSHFVKRHEFTKLLLVQALRQFLWSFRLPGEAMQIDRIMDSFSSHYCSQNPNLFKETDTCFILSFSIIMLNTALHNPNAKMKITVEQFIKQNKGINSGRDLPADMLDAIYKSIKEEPFKIPEENYDDLMYTFFSPEREGWLLKQGGSWKTWKRRWFVLNDRCLYYFQHTAENVPKGIIPLENVRVRQSEDKHGQDFCFEIYSDSSEIIKGCKTGSDGTVIQGNHKQYRMSATSKEDRDCWIQCIQEAIREHPCYKIISDKKAAIRRRTGNRPISTSTN